MENPLWKKLQNDPALLKQFNQHQSISNGIDNNELPSQSNCTTNSETGDSSETTNGHKAANNYQNNSEQLQAQIKKSNGSNNSLTGNASYQQQHSYTNNVVDQQTQQQFQQYQQFMSLQSQQDQYHQNNNVQQNQETNPYMSNTGNSASNNGFYNEQYNSMGSSVKRRSPTGKRELGMVEKLVGSYGFVKCLDRVGRLFFHYSSFQAEQQDSNDLVLKVNDLIEFEEGTDKRNGKPIATNITKFQQNNQKQDKSSENPNFNMFNLNQMLAKNEQAPQQQKVEQSAQNFYNGNNQHQSYQTIMNGLKMLNVQSLKNNEAPNAAAVGQNGQNGNFNPAIMSLFNKENIFNNSNNLNQLNANNSLLNIVKSGVPSNGANGSVNNNPPVNDNLANLARILNLNGISLNNLEAPKVPNNTANTNELMEGTIVTAAKKRPITSQFNNRNPNMGQQLEGSITYQQAGETFWIPYSLNDVVPPSSSSPMPSFAALKPGDRVRFYISPSGYDVVHAHRVELITDEFSGMTKKYNDGMSKQVYRGVISTLKESFGKIEREDMFKETFFHFNEYRGHNPHQELKLGLNVEFELQDRFGKEIACNVKMLQDGTVSFDELSRNVFIGRIIQPLTKLTNLMNNINLNGINLSGITSIGRLIFDNNSNNDETLTELVFSDLDRVANAGNYTLLEGDFVQFRIASDKRKKNYSNNTQMHRQQRATQITLIEEHSLVENSVNTGEYRERGVLVKLGTAKELVPHLDTHSQSKYGAIRCLEQNELVYFSIAEVINYVRFASTGGVTSFSVKEIQMHIGDSLEFSVIKCQKDPIFKSGLRALRIQKLANNTVQFEVVSTELYTGYIEREASSNEKSNGLIRLETKSGSSASSKTISFANESDKSPASVGDKVQFNMSVCAKSKKQTAVNIKLVEASKDQGFITMLKDNYGFIELTSYSAKNQPKGNRNVSIPRDIFFHFSSVQGLNNDLEVGDEVDFIINRKIRGDQKICAESINKLKNGSIKPNNLSSTIYKGRIVQQLRSHSLSSNVNIMNYSQEQHQTIVDESYYGKVMVTSSKKDNETVYEFGLCSLSDKKKCFQIGDLVTFQLASFTDGVRKAFNLQLQSQQQEQRNQRGNNDNKKGRVDSIKGHCGFIEYSINSNNDLKKVFFHISDLVEGSGNGKSESSNININDEVEFILMHNSRTGKYSAIKIRKANATINSKNSNLATSTINHSSSTGKDLNEQQEAAPSKRPEHLITKLKIGNMDISGRQLILIRQPSKPDGKSFCRELYQRKPGSFEAIDIQKTEILVSEPGSNATEALDDVNSQAQAVSPLSIVDLIIANDPATTK